MTSSSLNGIGVQNSGSGSFHVGGNLTISVRDKDQCLANLYCTDPTHDKKRIEETKGGLLRDSYRWILDHDDFKQWRDGENPLLWIKGDPGKGKTMLLCGIIDELALSRKLANAETELLLSYFFCQATDSRLNSATSVLRGLIWQLAKQQPVLIEHIWKEYDRKGKTVFEDANACVALSEILTNMMQDSSFQRAYLIIDALDECTTGLPSLLKFIITQSAALPRVKWVVASRNWPEIEEPFTVASQKVKLCLELNSASISAAVYIYIDRKIEELAQLKRYNKKTRDAVYQHLSSNADDTFLWVALVCQHLTTISRWDVLNELYTIPSGLDSLYQQMMKRVLHSANPDFCKRILAIISTVFQPITTDELGCFVETFQNMDDNDLVDIIGLCGSFLTVRDRTIYFVHQSAKDFLRKVAADENVLSRTEQTHHQIFSASLNVMSKTLCRDVYKQQLPGISINQVKQPKPDPLARVRYSCIYWVDHLQVCPSQNAEDIRDEGSIHIFMRQTYLYWLEALSLLESMSAGIFAIQRLDGMLQNYKSQLAKLIRDQYRFIQYHGAIIESNPLQTYVSALLFSPHHSITRYLFNHMEPEWVITKPIAEDDWSACIQTFEGHTDCVTSVVFSPDGQLLASTSWDCTVKLWDRAGACIQTFEGHTDSVTSVVFSPDGQLLASASWDCTVRLWDRTGACVQTFEGHTNSVTSVVFSPDGQLLASASWDSTVKLWDRTGACVQTFKGHTNTVTSVVFSPDGQLLASASWDHTVRLWDRTGACVQTFKDHITLHLSFDSTGRILHTSQNTIVLNTPPQLSPLLSQEEPRRRSYRLNANRTWIIRDDDEKLVWLPPDYRPVRSAIVGSKVAIACWSNRVILLEFSDKLMT